MEPNLVRKDIGYQKKILVIVSVLVACLFIGGSFALLSSSDKTEEVVTFKTGNFNLEIKTTGILSLEGELPKSYEDGFKSNDITLTLTNKGTLEIGRYEVKLEGDSTTNLGNNYIRYSVSEDEGKTYLAARLLSDTNNIIYTGYSLKDTKTLKLKLWIDEDAGSNALKKIYNGKINVELYQNEDTLVNVVKSKLVSNYSGSKEDFPGGVVAVNNDGDLYHEVNSGEIREYRYSGQSVNNYVTFNNETWRILGVFKDEKDEEHVKIVKNEIMEDIFPVTYKIGETIYNVKSAENGIVFWNNKTSGTNNNDWATAGLQYFLNTTKDETEGEPNKGYLSYLKSDSLSMIEEATYYLGSTNYIKDTITSYEYERSVGGCEGGVGPKENNSQSAVEENATCRVWAGNKAIWMGKIALMYPSDYGFSTNSSYWNGNPCNIYATEAANTSWLKQTVTHIRYEWLLSPALRGADWVAIWSIDYNVGINILPQNRNGVRPVLYLKNEVRITSGDGTSAEPYKLIMD